MVGGGEWSRYITVAGGPTIMSREAELLDRYRGIISQTEQILMYPFVMASQEGAVQTNVDDEEAIDFFAAWAAGSAGFRHPTVIQSLRDQIDDGFTNSILSIPTESVVELAERLVERFDAPFDSKVWVGHAGSDAGDLVARAAPAAAEADTIVTFEGSYHGGLSGSAAISGHSAQAGSAAKGVITLPFPDQFRAQDPEAESDDILEGVKTAFEEADVAAVITEPLQSDGGIRVPPEGFLQGLEDLCRDYGAYFVIDEVKAGLGRTGEFWAYDHFGVQPDAVMLGKPLGSGLPISALVGRADLVDYEPATHMMTTSGAPMCTAAALGTLEAIETDNLVAAAREKGERMAARLREETAELPEVGDVRGLGMMLGLELVQHDSMEPNPELTAKIALRARELGLLIAYVGMNSNVLELTPPLSIEEATLDDGMDRLFASIETADQVDTSILEEFAGW